ncbi:PAS domain S-box protein [Nitrospira sp. Nam74]
MANDIEANYKKQKSAYFWLPFLIVTLVGLAAITAAIALDVVKSALLRTTGESLALAAAEVAEKLDRVLFERYGDVQMVSRTLSGQTTGYAVRDPVAYLNELRQAYPLYRWLGMTDRVGRVTTATNEMSVGQDFSRKHWFQGARDQGRVSMSDVEPFEASDGGMDVLVFAAPRYNATGEFDGVVMAVVTMQGLEDLVTRTIQLFKIRQGLLGTVQYQFLNARGNAVVDSDLEHKGFVNLKQLGVPSAFLSESGHPGFVEEDHSRDHTRVVTGYAHTRGIRDFKGPDWTVLLRTKQSEFLGPLQALIARLALGAAAIGLPLVALLLWMQKRLRQEWGEAQAEKRRAVAAEEHVSSIVQASNDAILSIDNQGGIVFWNRGAERMFGYSADQMMGESITRILPERFRQPLLDMIEGARTAGVGANGGHVLELVGVRKDGVEFPSELSLGLWTTEAGQCFTAILRDISERKYVEAALRDSEARYSLVMRGSYDGIWDWNVEKNQLYLSERWKSLLGFQDDEIQSTLDVVYRLVHPEDLAYVKEALRRHLEEHTPYEVECRLQCRNGEYRWFQSRGQAVWNADGQPIRMAGSISDVTKRKWTEDALQRTCEELEGRIVQRTAELAAANSQLQDEIAERREAESALHRANETLEERVKERTQTLVLYQEQLRSLAWELRRTEERERRRLATELHDNLAQMLAFCNLKLGRLHKDGTVKPPQALEDVKAHLDEALTYTRQLMSDLRPVTLGDGDDLASAVQWVIAKVERHGLTVRVRDDGKPKPVDEEVLRITYQSLHELLFNVLKHAQTRHVAVRLRRYGQKLCMVVRDRGVGFATASERRPSQQGGFGLFNMREQIDQLGGDLTIISVPQKGTLARIMLPLHVSEPVDSAPPTSFTQTPYAEQSSSEPPSRQPGGQKIRVLLVDDHRMLREGLRSIIDEQIDLQVVAEASNGQMAIEAARSCDPNVVVMDVNMPTMNGVEATRLIRALHPNVAIIGLSVLQDQKMAELMAESGASAYLSKADAFETLSATIRSLVGRHQPV